MQEFIKSPVGRFIIVVLCCFAIVSLSYAQMPATKTSTVYVDGKKTVVVSRCIQYEVDAGSINLQANCATSTAIGKFATLIDSKGKESPMSFVCSIHGNEIPFKEGRYTLTDFPVGEYEVCELYFFKANGDLLHEKITYENRKKLLSFYLEKGDKMKVMVSAITY